MLAHQKFFWMIAFFLLGVFLASLFSALSSAFWLASLIGGLFVLSLLLFRAKVFAWMAIFILVGAGYFQLDESFYQNRGKLPDEGSAFTAVVVGRRISGKSQRLDLDLGKPYSGKVRIYASLYPDYRYGDRLSVYGDLIAPEGDGSQYYRKERILAISAFPELEKIGEGGGFFLKRWLLALRDMVADSFWENLSPDEAGFMTGITLGKSAELTDEFEEDLRLTGTTHLIALSGYNITIISKYFFSFLLLFLARRRAFIFSILAIGLFVLMTGAEASVVRAGVMGVLILVANQSGRIYSFKNAIAFTALIMTLFNPRILVFDIGFQLSFAALLGIVYLRPAIEGFFSVNPAPGFLAWRDNLLTTVAAQLAVLPILINTFGFVSLVSVLTNVLILTFIPVTMLLGLLIFIASIASKYVSLVFALLAKPFLVYELGVIKGFANFAFGLELDNLPLVFTALFYGALIGFILYNKKRAPSLFV